MQLHYTCITGEPGDWLFATWHALRHAFDGHAVHLPRLGIFAGGRIKIWMLA